MRGNTSKKIARNVREFEQAKNAFLTETGNPAHVKPKKWTHWSFDKNPLFSFILVCNSSDLASN